MDRINGSVKARVATALQQRGPMTCAALMEYLDQPNGHISSAVTGLRSQGLAYIWGYVPKVPRQGGAAKRIYAYGVGEDAAPPRATTDEPVQTYNPQRVAALVPAGSHKTRWVTAIDWSGYGREQTPA